jgi:hypothetical protein
MTFLAKPSVAVGFGAFMLCAETCDHWNEIASLNWVNMPLHDWTAAFLLIAVGVVHRQDFQAMAWAFMLSLLFGAFFGHLERWLGPPEPDAWIPERIVFPTLVALNVIALLGLVGTLKLRSKTSTLRT